ncbi:hypothetical protein V2M14_11265, partial [Streptococcus pneumoniae]
MIQILALGLLAAASAAPHYDHRRHSPFDSQNEFDLQPYFSEELFDTHRFWKDLELQFRQMDAMLENFHRHFPKIASSAGLVGNEYKVVIPLTGFDSKDIIVKAHEGLLMVQAVHKFDEGSQSHYLDTRTLPAYVAVSGVWTFENGVLTIVFPVKADSTTTEAPSIATEGLETVIGGSGGDREEMGNPNEDNIQDVDVGVNHNDE